MDGFVLDCGGRRLAVPRTQQRLLAFLGLRQQATRAQTVGTLWPESDEQKASGRLRSALWRLHQHGAPMVAAEGETLRLHEWVRVDVDELIRTARFVSAEGARDTETRGRAFRDMRELLPGWYDDWVLIERERLRQLRLHALEALAVRDLETGRHGDAVEAALAAMRTEPLRESAQRLLMEIHLAEGNYSEALLTYESYRSLLHRELGVEPSPRMRELLVRARPLAAVPNAG
ncbi:BTAD domain-containing putative transcriptional regulator [Amycolatopsis sp. NPDC059021]|uniref:AfsR/SARP family transcriptional regulator n=1 Tax=Amycolatopsis sp. NPDC059021 TaxID=3346704 RepID=UPI00366F9A5B